ncbi:glycosyltransferase family 39 protein, partial [Aldersonia kunmingensis]|uniref:glycosyltransferase family 39 protein n=1 Tax=Aldersonia kunmingensis TaxID=408066 RepID=UPI000A00358F
SSWSILVPQALLGVGSVALLWATVRRYFGAAAGLLAGLVLALTPVAVLMFRFNNPDALLVFLMIAAVWAMLRAVSDGRWRWLVLTGVFVGFGFLTKQLQVMLVVPPLALTYLIAGPPKLGKRIAQLFAALAAVVVSAGLWLAIVELWPASSRPWIGGSQDNSILELTLGYNGLGRLSGNERGSVVPGGGGEALAQGAADGGGFPGGGGPGGGMWGETGVGRMFDASQGGQIAWLIPAALALLVLGLVLRGRAPRTDLKRASLIVWGGWLLVTGLTFSFMAGIFHAYYTVALAPAIAALVGAGSVLAWKQREKLWVRLSLAATVALTGVTSWVLLSRTTDFVPWVRWVVLLATILAAVLLALPKLASGRVALVTIGAAMIAGLAGPVAYAADTISTPHTGSIVSAGPNTGFGPGGMGGHRDGMRDGGAPNGMPGMPGAQSDGAGQMPGGPGGMMPGGPGGMPQGRGMTPPIGQRQDGGMGQGGPGGLLNGSNPSEEMIALLEDDADSFTWVAAAIGSQNASGYQLATEEPVMPIGGFNGTDPSPTLDEFKQYVAAGEIHYFIGGGGGPGGREGHSSDISQWVQDNFTAKAVGGATVYDLTAPTS